MKPYVTVVQLAEILGVSTSTIYKRIESKELPSKKVNNQFVIPGTYQDWLFDILYVTIISSWDTLSKSFDIPITVHKELDNSRNSIISLG